MPKVKYFERARCAISIIRTYTKLQFVMEVIRRIQNTLCRKKKHIYVQLLYIQSLFLS